MRAMYMHVHIPVCGRGRSEGGGRESKREKSNMQVEKRSLECLRD